jgi:hypothetical protein
VNGDDVIDDNGDVIDNDDDDDIDIKLLLLLPVSIISMIVISYMFITSHVLQQKETKRIYSCGRCIRRERRQST